MSTLTKKLKSGDYQIRFKLDSKWIVVKGRTLVEALKKVNAYKPVYL
jgi:hypothetical protein